MILDFLFCGKAPKPPGGRLEIVRTPKRLPRGAGRSLSMRDHEMLRMIARGATTVQTASGLSLSLRTVEKHRGKLMEKLGVGTTEDLIECAIGAGPSPARQRTEP